MQNVTSIWQNSNPQSTLSGEVVTLHELINGLTKEGLEAEGNYLLLDPHLLFIRKKDLEQALEKLVYDSGKAVRCRLGHAGHYENQFAFAPHKIIGSHDIQSNNSLLLYVIAEQSHREFFEGYISLTSKEEVITNYNLNNENTGKHTLQRRLTRTQSIEEKNRFMEKISKKYNFHLKNSVLLADNTPIIKGDIIATSSLRINYLETKLRKKINEKAKNGIGTALKHHCQLLEDERSNYHPRFSIA